MDENRRYKILIVDDSAMNRTILSDILDEKFDIVEAEDGAQAISIIKQQKSEISLVLLDLVMPGMDGFEVMAMMNRYGWIDDIPVIMISSENSPTYIERAYELGATDFISRPFNVFVVRNRVANTIMLYAKQKSLVNMVNKQMYERIKSNDIMLNILSHIVEFRNGESGLHILHVNTITELLLKRLIQKTDKYPLTNEDIEAIVIASSLHDIGKITIPDEILNKPGRYTSEEFEIMKRHSQAGADMLNAMTEYADELLVIYARDICLFHHERYDGRGYPFGISGDDIPIWAQVVALADVYDALTSERCYKKALPHSEAMEMIHNGECGAFNPLLLECFDDIESIMEKNLKLNSPSKRNLQQVKYTTDELLRNSQFSNVDNSINYFEQERIKNEFYASLSQEIQYEYVFDQDMLTISEWCANKFGLPQVIVDPRSNDRVMQIAGGKRVLGLFEREMSATSVDDPVTQFELIMEVDGEPRHHRVYCRVNWNDDDEPKMISTIGKIVDIEDEFRRIQSLEKSASIDTLTNVFNRGYSESLIRKILRTQTSNRYALMLFDVDDFKGANDTYGHLFGDKVLKTIAVALMENRKNNIVARIGGDEFIMFVKCESENDFLFFVQRVFDNLNSLVCDDYEIHLSLGVATTDDAGYDYRRLFKCADSALYHSKRNKKGRYAFYDDSMSITDEDLTPIEN